MRGSGQSAGFVAGREVGVGRVGVGRVPGLWQGVGGCVRVLGLWQGAGVRRACGVMKRRGLRRGAW